MKFPAKIESGKLQADQNAIREWVSKQKDMDCILEIRKVKSKPNQTMRYLYKIYSIFAKGYNSTPAKVKTMVKVELLHYENYKSPSGKEILEFWSTADYTQEMYNDAIELIIYWGALNDIYIMTSEEYKLQFES